MNIFIYFLCIVFIGNIQAEQFVRYDPQRYYPLPKYPRLFAQVAVNGDFTVELNIDEGIVKNLNVISTYVFREQSGKRIKINSFDSPFIASITDSVNNWRFSKQIKPGIKHLSVSFRVIVFDSNDPCYYIYKVEGADESMWEAIPTKILVEYHEPIQIFSSTQ